MPWEQTRLFFCVVKGLFSVLVSGQDVSCRYAWSLKSRVHDIALNSMKMTHMRWLHVHARNVQTQEAVKDV